MPYMKAACLTFKNTSLKAITNSEEGIIRLQSTVFFAMLFFHWLVKETETWSVVNFIFAGAFTQLKLSHAISFFELHISPTKQ